MICSYLLCISDLQRRKLQVETKRKNVMLERLLGYEKRMYLDVFSAFLNLFSKRDPFCLAGSFWLKDKNDQAKFYIRKNTVFKS